MNVLVRLGGFAPVYPGNWALIWDAAPCLAAALERVVSLLCAINPGVEQSDMTAITASVRTKSTNKVTWLEVVPRNFGSDFGKAYGGKTWMRSVKGHRDEARAVGTVECALRVWVRGGLGVRDMACDPVLSAGDDFVATDRGADSAAAAAAGALNTALFVGRTWAVAGDKRAARAARVGELTGAWTGWSVAGRAATAAG
jgi:hypothetical protein